MTLKECKKNKNHWYSDHLSSCPWCEMAKTQHIEFFPCSKKIKFPAVTRTSKQVSPYQNKTNYPTVTRTSKQVSPYQNKTKNPTLTKINKKEFMGNIFLFITVLALLYAIFLVGTSYSAINSELNNMFYSSQSSSEENTDRIIESEILAETDHSSQSSSEENTDRIIESEILAETEFIQKNIVNTIDMDFVFIPSGDFTMGSQLDEIERANSEGPLHQVTFKEGFYLGKYEVTQKQWLKVMGDNPSQVKGLDKPVTHISWNDAQKFVNKLNEVEGTDKYRLPSEAEWEYSARAGTTTKYFFGDDATELKEYAWYNLNSDAKIHAVGQKEPNQWGLYDMYGNVVEWTQDEWHFDYTDAPTDGSAWEGSNISERVVRGGGCNYFARYCRSSSRSFDDQDNTYNRRGLRVVMNL